MKSTRVKFIPAETILERAVMREGFSVPRPEDLLTLKYRAYTSRLGSSKGRKDLVDIVSLLGIQSLDWTRVPIDALTVAMRQTEIPELSLNRHVYARMKAGWKTTVAATAV